MRINVPFKSLTSVSLVAPWFITSRHPLQPFHLTSTSIDKDLTRSFDSCHFIPWNNRPSHPLVGDAASNLATSLAFKGMMEEAKVNVAKAEAAWLSAFGHEQGTSRSELLKARVKSYVDEVALEINAVPERAE